MVRYADDLVICCNKAEDGPRILTALERRLTRFKLRLNKEKTKIVKFSRLGACKGLKQDTFDFLGFTFYLARSRKGKITTKLKTSKTRMCSKLKRVNEWARNIRCRLTLKEIWSIFRRKLQGHMAYYSVSHNMRGIENFFRRAVTILYKWMSRRSQKRSLTWDRFRMFMAANPLPRIQIVVPLFSLRSN